jgi:uncharacterized LabA/DUF88 family protein
VAVGVPISHAAHFDNYDVACLVAGDGDYVPLVEEVKRLGKVVYVAFFRGEGLGLSPELRLASDMFLEMDGFFAERWTAYTTKPEPRDS